MTLTVSEQNMVISLLTFHDEDDNSFGVEVLVSGLQNQQLADKAMDYIQSVLCGKEITVN